MQKRILKTRLEKESMRLNARVSLLIPPTHWLSLIDLLPDTDSGDTDRFVAVSNRDFNWNREIGEYWTCLRKKISRFTADKYELDMTAYTTKPFGNENFQ